MKADSATSVGSLLRTLWYLLRERFEAHPDVAEALPEVGREVVAGKLDPTAAARRLVNLFLGRSERDRDA